MKAPVRGFDGANKNTGGGRSKPVEFEKEKPSDNYFGMDSFVTDKVNKKLKKE